MNKDREVRAFHVAKIELRDDGDGLPAIRGHAAVFDSWSEDLGGFREIIRPGAFDSALDRGDDVRALVDHDPSKIIGRAKAGTLSLNVDSRGLRVAITPPDTSVGRDIVESIRRGDVDSMSFGFRTLSDRWGNEDGSEVRELLDVELFDVSPVSFPAYTQTDVAVRSLTAFRKRTKYKEPMNEATRERIALVEAAMRELDSSG